MTDSLGSDPYDAQTRADLARLADTRGKPRLDLTPQNVPAKQPTVIGETPSES